MGGDKISMELQGVDHSTTTVSDPDIKLQMG